MVELEFSVRDEYAELVLGQITCTVGEDEESGIGLTGAARELRSDLIAGKQVTDPEAYFGPVASYAARRLYKDFGEEDSTLYHPEVLAVVTRRLVEKHVPEVIREAAERAGPCDVEVELSDFRRNRKGQLIALHTCNGHTSAYRIPVVDELTLRGGVPVALRRAGYAAPLYKIVHYEHWASLGTEAGEPHRLQLFVYRLPFKVGDYSEEDLITGKEPDETETTGQDAASDGGGAVLSE